MSFFKSLFGGPQSPARAYLVNKIDRMEAGELEPDEKFRMLLLGAIEIFGTNKDRKPQKQLEPFTGDAALFELACYVIALTADHLKYAKKEVRNWTIQTLLSETNLIFEELLPDKADVRNLVIDRLSVYHGSINSERIHILVLSRFLKVASILKRPTLSSDSSFVSTAAAFNQWSTPEGIMLKQVIEIWDQVWFAKGWTDLLDKVAAMPLESSNQNDPANGKPDDNQIAQCARKAVAYVAATAEHTKELSVVQEIINASDLKLDDALVVFHSLNIAIVHSVAKDLGFQANPVFQKAFESLIGQYSDLVAKLYPDAPEVDYLWFLDTLDCDKPFAKANTDLVDAFMLQIEEVGALHLSCKMWSITEQMYEMNHKAMTQFHSNLSGLTG